MTFNNFLILSVLIILSSVWLYYFISESTNFFEILKEENKIFVSDTENYINNDNLLVYTNWFSLSSSVKKDYDVEINNERNTVEISKKNNDPKLKDLNLYAIYFKRSSVYDISTSILLTNLKNLFNVRLIVHYVDYDENLTLKILDEINRKNEKSIILSVGSDTTDFLFSVSENYGNLIFVSLVSKDPKIMGYVNNINEPSGKNFVLTSFNVLPELQFQYITTFFENLEKIIILVDYDNRSSIKTQYLPLKEMAESSGIKVYPVIVKANQKDSNDINNKLETELKNVKEKISKDGYNKNNTLIIVTTSTILIERYFIVNKIFSELLICSLIPNQTIGRYENTASFGIGVTIQKSVSLVTDYILKIVSGEKPENIPVGYVYPPDISINVTHFRKKNLFIPEKLLLVSNLVYSD